MESDGTSDAVGCGEGVREGMGRGGDGGMGGWGDGETRRQGDKGISNVSQASKMLALLI